VEEEAGIVEEEAGIVEEEEAGIVEDVEFEWLGPATSINPLPFVCIQPATSLKNLHNNYLLCALIFN
jgi:hypothetical protein